MLSIPTLVSFAIAAIVLVFLVVRFDIDFSATWERIRTSNPLLYGLGLLLYYTTFPFRGLRWRILLTNAGVAREAPLPTLWAASRLILLGWMVSAVSWFRMGDAFRAYAYTLESGATLPRSVGTVVAERVLDVVTIFLLLLAGFLLLYVDGELRPSKTFLVVALGLLILAGLLLPTMHLLRVPLAKRLPRRIQGVYHSFHEGTMGSFRQLPLVALLGLLAWLAEVARLYFVVQAAGVSVGIGLIMFVTIANALLSAVPLTPGGLGIVETGIVGLLTLALPEHEDAVSVALLDRSISYLSVILFGIVAFLLHRRSVSKQRRASSALTQGHTDQAEAT